LLPPAEDRRERRGRALRHDLDHAAFPVEERGFHTATRTVARVVVRCRAKTDFLAARRALQRRAFGRAKREPGRFGCAHERQSSEGKYGNWPRHQRCPFGDKESHSTIRAGIVVSPSNSIAAARWWPPN